MTDDTGPENAVVLERTMEAPADLVWQMWTDSSHFSAWYGPTGATIPVASMDVRVGGTRRVCMNVETPTGTMRLWFSGE